MKCVSTFRATLNSFYLLFGGLCKEKEVFIFFFILFCKGKRKNTSHLWRLSCSILYIVLVPSFFFRTLQYHTVHFSFTLYIKIYYTKIYHPLHTVYILYCVAAGETSGRLFVDFLWDIFYVWNARASKIYAAQKLIFWTHHVGLETCIVIERHIAGSI